MANPYFGLFDEMGGMKTAQAIIAAQMMYYQGTINRVIVIAPASVRPVWFDPELGELSLHLFDGIPARVSEFHTKIRQWDWGKARPGQLRWIITNYEFLGRSSNFVKRGNKMIPAVHIKTLLKFCGPKTMLVLDESSAVKTKTTYQSRACLVIRKACGRVLLLNGTPIADNPMDLMNQGNIMSPSILQAPYLTVFRERYCNMRPFVDYPQVLSWKNLDDLQRRFAPYVLRRLKEDCLDLPPKLPPVMVPVPLTKETWNRYKQMRDDLCVWMSDNEASLAPLVITKVMRLAQLCSGLLGGVEEVFPVQDQGDMPAFMQDEDWFKDVPKHEPTQPLESMQEVSTEKLDALVEFIDKQLKQDPAFKVLIWCRFRAEVDRVVRTLERQFRSMDIIPLVGSQPKSERDIALRLLNPRTANPVGSASLIATIGTGSVGHNFTAAAVAINLSPDYSLFKYKQGSDRVHRPGQTKPVSYFDFVAVGPRGQKTIDHTIIKARKEKDDIATWTSNAWVRVLKEE